MRKLSEKSILLLALLSMVLLIQLSFSQVSAITCLEKELEALLRLKKSFIDPSHRLASWKGTDCCNWDGVGCNETTGYVTKIDLRNTNEVFPALFLSTILLSNSIDSSLLEFKYLNYLDLSWNFFHHSQIPNFFGSMLELRYLNLSAASFSGKVPPHIGNLTKLVVLDLSFIDFYNERSKLLNSNYVEWISHLSSLKFLYLSGMNFSDASNLMGVVSSLPLLSSLRLRSCSLQNLPLSLGSLNSSFLTTIQLLDLSSNYFSGPIPKAFQNMTSLRSLYLSDNQFTSVENGLSSFIGSNCRLKIFDLSRNSNFGGDVFGSYENVSLGCNRYHLQVLDLSNTNTRNKIPNWLGMFKQLQSLDLLDSNISGRIPTSLGNLSNIQYLDLSQNNLNGAIPTSIGTLLNLRSLRLGYNRLKEVGEECFGSLEELDISRNLLKGIVTETHFANLSQLQTLLISNNELLSLDMKSDWVPPFQLNFLDADSCIGCFGSKFPQ
ncbi:probable inactive leucine-rich repeat receptor kinase XIAO [Momordica charantia]|uniref:Probable inactive leucine-rich repeat receptor kinase XIAO n=1 Tax=Momordica charantia TaxID=3673 RepID=A0A6J1D5N3_MOMCH|nr:probable inactive leucine-rich repeat receptor kinase XIAO [Momordica charantia]